MDIYKAFLAELRVQIARRGRGAQVNLANSVNITPKYLNDILAGRRTASQELQANLAKALGINFEEMLLEGMNNLAGTDQPSETDNEIRKSFTDRLKQVAGDLTAREFAKKCGINTLNAKAYLSGWATPIVEILYKISAATGVSSDWLIFGKGPQYKKDIAQLDDRDEFFNDIKGFLARMEKQDPDIRPWFRYEFKKRFPEFAAEEKKMSGDMAQPTTE